MAFTADTLNVVLQTIGGVGPRWFFYQTDDDSTVVLGAAYFIDIAVRGMKVNDLIFIVPLTGDYEPYTVTVDVVNAAGNGTVIRDQPIDTAFYESRAAAAGQRIPANIQALQTGGYAAGGDGGGDLYQRVETEPDHIGKFQSLDGAWWESEQMRSNGRRLINVLSHGIFPGENVTTQAKALYEGADQDVPLENASVFWPPGVYTLNDAIFVWGDNVETYGAGRLATNLNQLTWGRMVFATGHPTDDNVRPNGVKFHDFGGTAWNDGVRCYFYDFQAGPDNYIGDTVFVVGADSTTTEANNIYVFRDNVLENAGSVAGTGSTRTVTLSSPILAGENVVIKITNKDDMYSNENIEYYFAASQGNRANESALIWHGGGDNFTVYNLHAEGFVAPLAIYGDWTSDLADRQSSYISVHDITSNNCEFILAQELIKAEFYNIYGGKISETQTDNGIKNYQYPSGLTNATYKDPHVLYFANVGTLSVSQDIYVGTLEADNDYSSNYKFRNVNGLTIKAPLTLQYHRMIDIDTCSNIYGHFPYIIGSNTEHIDTQRAALMIRSITDAVFVVERMEVFSDLACAILFDSSDAGVCENVDVYIGRLHTNGTSARTRDWVVNQGGQHCWIYIKNWFAEGADTVHLARFRDGALEGGGYTGCTGGGIVINQITCLDSRSPLRIARLSTENSTVPTNVTVDFAKSRIVGTYTLDSNTISNVGTGTMMSGHRFGVDTINTNTSFTMTVVGYGVDVVHTGTLTADRTITLATTNAQLGDKFRITRTGGDTGGPWVLNVGTGPLKALTTGTWCEVVFNGTAWYLAAYGAL